MALKIDCFKAYDIRGQVPNDLNTDIAYRVANATVEFLDAKTMVIGRDIRLTSAEFADAVAAGIQDAGADVIDIGIGGTEMVYFGTGELQADGGIMITASHNPVDYNGLKLVRNEARPISGDTGLKDIRAIAERDERRKADSAGTRKTQDISQRYIERLLSFIDKDKLEPLRIVTNAGNGGAGITLDKLEPNLPFEYIKVFHKADGKAHEPSTPFSRARPISASPGTATSTAASSGTRMAASSKATTSSGCWRRRSCRTTPVPPSSTTRTCPRDRTRRGDDAQGERALRRRNERAPLLPRLLLLR